MLREKEVPIKGVSLFSCTALMSRYWTCFKTSIFTSDKVCVSQVFCNMNVRNLFTWYRNDQKPACDCSLALRKVNDRYSQNEPLFKRKTPAFINHHRLCCQTDSECFLIAPWLFLLLPEVFTNSLLVDPLRSVLFWLCHLLEVH